MNMTQKVENIRTRHWWDLWIALTIIATVTMVAARLWTTEWASDLYILVFLSFFAGLTGVALGSSRFSAWVSGIISAVYGLFITGWLFGLTVDMELPWRERIFYFLGWRLRYTFEQFITNRPITDPILFLTVLALLIWVIGTLSTFLIIRKGVVWPALLPLGITLLVISHFDQNLIRNTRFLMTFIFFTLLVLGRMTFLRLQKQWLKEGIGTPSDTHSDLSKTLILLAFLLLIIAWAVPITPSQVTGYSRFWDGVTQTWDQFWDQVPDLITITRNPTRTTAGIFGDTLELGNGSPSSEDIVFTVKPEAHGLPDYRNYWRARVYDTYEDDDWYTNPGLDEAFLFPENFNINHPNPDLGQVERYAITSDTNRMINLYAPGQPVGVDRPVTALTQPISETEQDLVALIADPAIAAEDTYQVESRVYLPSIIELRNTNQAYPEWLNRYLQLPEDFSEEIANLALEITKIYNNPYDKAAAITRYLRQNIEYSRTIPNRPNRVDPIEWFLFDIKTGFCNYYATAQVLMLRSIGIPSRIGVGYAQGEFDPETQSYIVRRLDSHAWPEVYFVDVGWVIFEPTTDQPTLNLPFGEQEINEEGLPLLPENPIEDRLPEPGGIPTEPVEDAGLDEAETERSILNIQPKTIVWIILSLFGLGLATWLFIRYRPSYIKFEIDPLPVILERALLKRNMKVPEWLKRWRYLSQMSIPEKAYRQMGWSIRILGQPLYPAETPKERAQRLTKLMPELELSIQDIINEYNLDQFSNHIINEERAKRAAQKVRNLAVKTRLQKLFSFPKTLKQN